MIIDIDPVAKPRMTRRDVWKERPVVVRYRNYCDELRMKLPRQMTHPDLNAAITKISIIFYLPMPKSWSKKKREQMSMKPHQQKPDLDNLLKGWMDALYRNDQVIWRVTMEKRWLETGKIQLNI